MGDVINDTRRIIIDFGLLGTPAAQIASVREALTREVFRHSYPGTIKLASLCNKCNSVSQKISELLNPQRTVQESDQDKLQKLRDKLVTNSEKLEEECSHFPEAFPQFVINIQQRLITARTAAMATAGAPSVDPSPGVKVLGPYPWTLVDSLKTAYLASLVSEKDVPEIPDDALGTPAGWRALQDLHGGMSTIKVFCDFDANETLVDRMVQKDTVSKSDDHFNQYRLWHGPAADGVPIEYWTQRLAVPKSKKSILGLRADWPIVDVSRRMYRMYLEYAAHSDLFHLMERHWGDGEDTLEPVSKPFVLCIFRSLVKALLALETGNGQRMIVHRDLKHENVFLDNPDKTVFPSYPQPKLADFGLAFLTTDTDPSNPALWQNSGTSGFMAPEMLEFIDDKFGQPVDDFKLLSPCNVWGVGATLYGLMTLEGPTEQPSYLPKEKDRHRLTDEHWGWYGRELCDLVNDCTLPEPDRRPTPRNLEIMVDELIGEDEASYEAATGPARPEDMVKMQSEIYRLGMSLGEAMQAAASAT